MLKRIMNYVKLCKFSIDNVILAKTDITSITVSTEDLQKKSKYGGLPIIHNNAILANSNVAIAGLVPFQEFVTNETVHAIVVDDIFYKLSKNTQRFVLYHELGREKLNLVNSAKSSLEYGIKRSYTTQFVQQEIKADTYAAEIIGYANAYKALVELSNVTSIFTTPEMRCRLKSLKKKIKK